MSANDVIARRYDEIVTKWRRDLPQTREELAGVLSDYCIYFAYNSGKIENPSITYHDVLEVFENGRVVSFTGDVRTLFEIQNQKECNELLLDAFATKRAIDESLVLEVHRALTQGTYDERRWARGERPGMYKVHDYVVGVNGVGSSPDAVAGDVRELLGELEAVTPSNVLTVAAYFHLAFEGIHPFADGNGRVGRALMNHLFVMNDHPPIIVYDEDKLAYYGAMQVWDDEGDLAPMLDFLRAEAVKTWS
ncbi:MAG: Fic family protein [Eggerthellaceae bacterium]|nr:Fic family protein [Eggerthellaceae bacterium]